MVQYHVFLWSINYSKLMSSNNKNNVVKWWDEKLMKITNMSPSSSSV